MQKTSQAQVISMFPGAGEGESPEVELRQLADGFDAEKVEGAIIAYRMSDGTVGFKLMGVWTENENRSDAATVAGELKRRIERSLIFYPQR